MASRWAFEAYMVTQFKDNPYEREFYEADKKEAIAEYKRVFYIPALESRLAEVLHSPNQWRDTREDNPVKNNLDLLRTEINYEMALLGENKFPEVELLQVGKFDSVVYDKAASFLSVLKKYYTLRLSNAIKDREAKIAKLTSTPEKLEAFNNFRLRHANESVTRMVENSNEPSRIVEWHGELIQKVYPIYFNEHRPKNKFDFTTNFFSPDKHFLGKTFDTYYFNICMIWFMVLVMYIALYFDLLSKLVNSISTWQKYRRKKKLEF